MTDLQKKLYEAASTAQKHAHAPYSGAFIGAAILTGDGKIYSGCNVENASFGGTVCAGKSGRKRKKYQPNK
jgi:cytidine deaminase